MLSSLLANKRLLTVCVVVFIVILLISFRNTINFTSLTSFKKLFEGFQEDTAKPATLCDGIRARRDNLQKAIDEATSEVLKKNLMKAMEIKNDEYTKNSC